MLCERTFKYFLYFHTLNINSSWMHFLQNFAHCLIIWLTDTTFWRGALPLEGGMGMCRSDDPHFPGQSVLPNLLIFHLCIFSLVFGQNFSSQDANFWIFAPKTPYFSRKTYFVNPTFGNSRGTCPLKKSWVPLAFLVLLFDQRQGKPHLTKAPCRVLKIGGKYEKICHIFQVFNSNDSIALSNHHTVAIIPNSIHVSFIYEKIAKHD